MSIATVGQAKYTYQDLVCLELILRFQDSAVVCHVEPAGGEDATLWITREGVTFQVELQVKGARSTTAAVDLPVLAEYLAHFPARKSTDFLLQRLVADARRVVVIVCAQRVKDDCEKYSALEDWDGGFHDDGSISIDAAANLVSAIARARCDGDKGGKLRTAREAALAEFPSSVSLPDVRRALPRLILLDHWTEASVRHFLEHRLRTRSGVVVDTVTDVLNRLLACLVSSKGSGEDVVPDLRQILSDARSPSIAPSNYVSRGQEQGWQTTLSEMRVLLLSGAPRCGKSDAARWTAGQLQAIGFSATFTRSLEHAERVLLDDNGRSTVVVLDDPLGAMERDPTTVLQALRHLEALVRTMQTNRRLIVAQAQEPLLAAARKHRLNEVHTSGHGWHDLSANTAAFLQEVWSACTKKFLVPETLNTMVADALRAGQVSFAPGVLSHIASQSDSLGESFSSGDVERLAQQSARDFGSTLAHNRDAESFVTALAIGTSEIEPIAERELAFILGQGGEDKKPNNILSSIVYGGEPEPLILPEYESQPILPSGAKDELLKLERHRVIDRVQDHEVDFSHPFYRAAARSVVEMSLKGQRVDILDAIQRGLFSLSAVTSAAVARNLAWLHREVSPALGIGQEVVKLAEDGLGSYFLTTRDLCYGFLVRLAHVSPQTYGARLPGWVQSATSISIDRLAWHGTTAFVPEGMAASGMAMMLERIRTPPEADVARTIKAMEEGEVLPDMRSAVELLRFYGGHPEKLSLKVASRFLGYDVGVLRAKAADLWLRKSREDDEALLDRLTRDTHPLVAEKACRSALLAWPEYSEERKVQVRGLLNAFVARPETAAVVLDVTLRLFDDDEGLHAKPWHAYEELIPKALGEFPLGFRLSAPRLYGSARRALEHLAPEPALALANAWIGWLERELASGELPDDFALGLWDAVVGAANLPAGARWALLDRLLSFQSTGCALTFVADVVDAWEELTAEERTCVLTHLSSDRADVVWLRAAAITREDVPPEVQSCVLGTADALSRTPSRLVEEMPDGLLNACVRLQCGHPQPLWYLGKHHQSRAWKDVVAYIARRPEDGLFEECFVEMVHAGDDEALCAVASALATVAPLRAFKIMVDRKVGVTGEWHQKAIDTLLQAADPEMLQSMHAHMIAKAPAILESLGDISEWTAHSDTQDALLGTFPIDESALLFLRVLRDSELSQDFIVNMLLLLRTGRPKLHKTYSAVLNALKAANASQSIVEEVNGLRRAAVDALHTAVDSLRPTKRGELPGWRGPPVTAVA